MANTALITGASSGIGLELAKPHGQKGGDMVLIARSFDKLEQLKNQIENQYQVTVTVLTEDLAKPGAAERIYAFTQSNNIDIDILINNAGFGGHGLFHQRDLKADSDMMQVNMRALTELCHFYLQGMVKRRHGKILNVSSTASFIPGPLQAVYYASKAYVTSFTQAIAQENAEYGITATALCPGAVKTGFVQAGDLNGVEVFDNAKSASSVALCGYRAMEKGQLIAFNESSLKIFLQWIVPLLPRKLVLKLSRQSMEKTA